MNHELKPKTQISTTNQNTETNIDTSETIQMHQSGEQSCPSDVKTSHVVTPTFAAISGGFGFYPMTLTIICFVRYVCLAMMTNSGPLLAPDLKFYCRLTNVDEYGKTRLAIPVGITQNSYLENKCSVNLTDGSQYKCQSWYFDTNYTGITLTDSLALVCDKNWYRSAFQSAISLGVVVAALIFGPISDGHGRLFVLRVCFVWSLIWGSISCLGSSFSLYALARACCSIGDIGLATSLSLVIIELVDGKLRGIILISVYTGWSLGVMIMPWITEYFLDYKLVTMFTVVCHLTTGPFLLIVGESSRWLMASGNIEEAKRELKRIRSLNRIPVSRDSQFEQDFELLKVKYREMARRRGSVEIELAPDDIRVKSRKTSLVAVLRTLYGSYSQFGKLFQSRQLAISTLSIVWIAFNGELFYMLFVMINSDIGQSLKANYAIGFLMELAATFVGILMTSYISRRLSLFSTITTISISCLLLACAHSNENLSVYLLNFAKIAISNLTSLVWVTSNEIFPTELRQTGYGITGALGSLGAVAAPFIRTELVNAIGMTSVMLILTCVSGLAASATLCLRETKDMELPDSLDDMENRDV